MVFDDIWRDSLCRSYQGFWQLANRQDTDMSDWHSWHMCHAISFMTYDESDLERFQISQEVTLFFYREYKFLFFDFPCV